MHNSLEVITSPGFGGSNRMPLTNTTIGVVATNAGLNKEQANKLASVAHDGLAIAVRPAHTMSDGDTLFALATGKLEGPVDMNRLCAASALCVSWAIVRGVGKAEGIGGIPGIKELVWCIRSSVVNKWVLYANPFLRFEQESGFLSFRKPSNNVVNYGYRTLAGDGNT